MSGTRRSAEGNYTVDEEVSKNLGQPDTAAREESYGEPTEGYERGSAEAAPAQLPEQARAHEDERGSVEASDAGTEPSAPSAEASTEGDTEDVATEVDVQALELEGEIAADYIEGLLDIADLDGDIDMDVEGDRAAVSVVGTTLDELVGEEGEVLEALQDLTRMAVHRQTGVRSRLMLDIGGYRARRRKELTELGQRIVDEVQNTRESREFPAMTPFERKVIHGVAAAAGLRSESEGEEPDRFVVVHPD